MGIDETRDGQRAEGAGGGQQSGVGAGHLVQGSGVDFEGRLILSWNACRHRHNIDILSIICQGENALGMRSFRHFTKLRADQGRASYRDLVSSLSLAKNRPDSELTRF